MLKSELANPAESAPTAIITLHAVTALESTSTLVSIDCNCKGRCRCLKNQVGCSVYCHSDDHDYGNLCLLETRTEMAHVDRVLAREAAWEAKKEKAAAAK